MEEMKKVICSECKAMVLRGEYHPYDYCAIAKLYPNEWRNIISRIQKGQPIKLNV